MPPLRLAITFVLIFLSLTPLLAETTATETTVAEIRDGRLHDPGATMTAPAEGAPADLARLTPLVGQWDVEVEQMRPDAEPLVSQGISHITFMNRGHGLMERTRFKDFDGEGNAQATLGFFSVTRDGRWTVSEGSRWTEAISVTSGGFEGEDLILHDAFRPGGGVRLLMLRRTYVLAGLKDGGKTFEETLELSEDLGETWTTRVRSQYRQREPSADFFPVRKDHGLAGPDRLTEAGEFDFLLGEYQASHWLRRPGTTLQWPANNTAVHVLDGYGILEFNWNDLDPSLPDAATTILRVYNSSMRRWESLFLTNRGHIPLHFGGVREDDRIVLHPFAAQNGSGPLSQWIFHDVRDNAYRWKGLSSVDRGQSWALTWGIDFVRKGTSPEVQAPSPVEAVSADGARLFGDLYRPAGPGAKTVVLFHQAGGDARGEYAEIARRLQEEGFEVFAWDVRGGGDRFGEKNRTIEALEGKAPEGYCPAYPDLEAALARAFEAGTGGPIYALGSSYSAALVVRLAAEHGQLLAGVAAFSPASGRMEECAVDEWLSQVEVPALAFRPAREMEVESAAAQKVLFSEHGTEVFIAEDAAHGASMLHPERSEGDVEPTWERLLAFLGDE